MQNEQMMVEEFDDDEIVVESADWRERIEPFMGCAIGADIDARSYRGLYGRPFRLMRVLAGLTVESAAELLGWSVAEVEKSEERSDDIGEIPLSRVQSAMSTLAFAIGHRFDASYAATVWGGALGEPVTTESLSQYMQFHSAAWAGQRLM